MEDTQALQEIPDNTVTEPVAAPAEKLLSQSEVAKIIQREKGNAKRAAEEEYMRKLEAVKQQGQMQEQRNENVPREADVNAMYQQVQEKFNQEMQQARMQEHIKNVADSYTGKMEAGQAAYPDFKEVMKDFEPGAFPQLVYLVAGIDNAADVMYDLAKNPSKLVTLDTLAQRAPKQAQAELLKLSRSIADNKSAASDAEGQSVSAPLDHLQPSRVSGSNGKMGIRDLRNQPWLRG